ncbi:MAG TPA: IS110 family transposase [Candidatus Enterenecus stercoripullorum]|nr:IS110 family transposase [Candidatus Enterenecus stercoripullorum]
MYFVGIDISKFKHDCAIIDELGDTVTPSWSFSNDWEGFSHLKALLDSLEGEMKIGLESTGHYGQNLKLFLESNGFTFMEFNPLLVSRFVRSKSLRNTKTDSIDALSIAHYVMTVEYKPYPPSFYHLDKLKSLTRFRDSLVRQRSHQLVGLTNVLDKLFPEFKPFFKGKLSVTALYILAHYQTPERIANMNARSYEALRKLSRGKFALSDFVQLKALAKNTVGTQSEYLLDQMNILLELYSQLDSKVDELDAQIKEYVRGIDPPCLSIPGIGELSAAVILSEFGDFCKFQNPSKMLAFAGLEPGYFQSGQSEYTGHMVKHGSSRLRYALMNCCLPLIANEPVFAEYYAKKRAEGKPYRVALTHVAKKLLRVIYTLQTKNIRYDPTVIR